MQSISYVSTLDTFCSHLINVLLHEKLFFEHAYQQRRNKKKSNQLSHDKTSKTSTTFKKKFPDQINPNCLHLSHIPSGRDTMAGHRRISTTSEHRRKKLERSVGDRRSFWSATGPRSIIGRCPADMCLQNFNLPPATGVPSEDIVR